MQRYLRTFAIIAWVLLPELAGAGPAPDHSVLSLDELISTALRNNKDIQAARHAVDTARARLVQSGSAPNPRLELSGRNDTVFSNDGEYAVSVGISQEFPIAGRIARQQDVARVDVALAIAEIGQAEGKLAGDVAGAYYRLLVLDEQLKAQQHVVALNTNLVKISRDRLRAAEVSEMDVTTAQLEQQRAQQQQALLATQRATQLAQLNQLLGRAAAEPLKVALTSPKPVALPSLEELQQQALAIRPDLRTEQLNADRARADQALARAERWEDWTVAVGVEQDRVVLDGVSPQPASRALGVSLSIPLPLKNNRQGRIAEALSAGAQARARAEALTFSIRNEITSRHAEVTQLGHSLSDYRQELLPAAEKNIALARQAYQQGLAPIFTVLQSQRQQAEVNTAYLDVLDRYWQSVVVLDMAAATYIQRPTPLDNSDSVRYPQGK